MHLKKHWKAACFFAVIMLPVLFYTLSKLEDEKAWLWLGAAVIAATLLFTAAADALPKSLQIIFTAAFPAIVFMLTESYTHMLSQMWTGPVWANLILYYLFFGVLLALTGWPALSMCLMILVCALAGLANYFVILFRSAPILPWDLGSFGVAMSVAGNFSYTLTVRACNVILLFMAAAALALKVNIRIRPKKKKYRAGALVLLVCLLAAFCRYVQTDDAADRFSMDKTLFTPKVMYRNNGLFLSFIVNTRYLHIEKPEGYSEEAALAAAQAADAVRSGDGEDALTEDEGIRPNIIVVMNEAFSDLRVLGDYETNKEVMPFIDSLSENTQKGYMYSSVLGGNTANTEYEFLTGSSLYWLPVGSVAYQQYLKDALPALPGQLSAQGYTSVAMHPYNASGWNRNRVYEYLGFDETFFLPAFKEAEKLRSYVTDWATYEKIIECYENKAPEDRLFVFDVTMQNHGSYTKRFDNFEPDIEIVDGKGKYLAATEQYLSLIRVSDDAFRDLCGYFSQQAEPTLILMFGDHQPADYCAAAVNQTRDDTIEGREMQYMVPFVLWANYDIEESEGDLTSANYLGQRLLKTAGLPLTGFQYFLMKQAEEIPVITANCAMDADGVFYDRQDEALSETLEDYAFFQYNLMVDKKNRLTEFFGEAQK